MRFHEGEHEGIGEHHTLYQRQVALRYGCNGESPSPGQPKMLSVSTAPPSMISETQTNHADHG